MTRKTCGDCGPGGGWCPWEWGEYETFHICPFDDRVINARDPECNYRRSFRILRDAYREYKTPPPQKVHIMWTDCEGNYNGMTIKAGEVFDITGKASSIHIETDRG